MSSKYSPAYRAYLERWDPERLLREEAEETKTPLERMGAKEIVKSKPKSKLSNKKLSKQKVDITIGTRLSTPKGSIIVRPKVITKELSLEATNKIANIIDKMNERTSSGGLKYKSDIFKELNKFEDAMKRFLSESSSDEIEKVMKGISWEGLDTSYGYNGNVADFVNELAKIADMYFGVSLAQQALASDLLLA